MHENKEGQDEEIDAPDWDDRIDSVEQAVDRKGDGNDGGTHRGH